MRFNIFDVPSSNNITLFVMSFCLLLITLITIYYKSNLLHFFYIRHLKKHLLKYFIIWICLSTLLAIPYSYGNWKSYLDDLEFIGYVNEMTVPDEKEVLKSNFKNADDLVANNIAIYKTRFDSLKSYDLYMLKFENHIFKGIVGEINHRENLKNIQRKLDYTKYPSYDNNVIRYSASSFHVFKISNSRLAILSDVYKFMDADYVAMWYLDFSKSDSYLMINHATFIVLLFAHALLYIYISRDTAKAMEKLGLRIKFN